MRIITTFAIEAIGPFSCSRHLVGAIVCVYMWQTLPTWLCNSCSTLCNSSVTRQRGNLSSNALSRHLGNTLRHHISGLYYYSFQKESKLAEWLRWAFRDLKVGIWTSPMCCILEYDSWLVIDSIHAAAISVIKQNLGGKARSNSAVSTHGLPSLTWIPLWPWCELGLILTVKLAQLIRCSLWVQEVVSSSPASTDALVKIECAWNSLGQGTHC